MKAAEGVKSVVASEAAKHDTGAMTVAYIGIWVLLVMTNFTQEGRPSTGRALAWGEKVISAWVRSVMA